MELGGGSTNDRAISDSVDSLMALKKVVFEDKQATMGEVLDALKADWEGCDELKRKCMSAPSYGNDDDEPDELFCEISKYVVEKMLSQRDWLGRRFTYYRNGAAWAQWAGKGIGALPNGRGAGQNLSDASASPCQGADVKGPTAVFNSVAKVDAAHIEGPLLNMKMMPGPLRTKEGRQKLADLMATYFDKGANHVQFLIVDRDTLLDAKAHPENYRSLVVRVAGYSAFWVELPDGVQDDIISRTEQEF